MTIAAGKQKRIVMGNESGNVSNYASADFKAVYDMFTTQQSFVDASSLVLQIFAVSDNVCRDYLQEFIDVKDTISFSTAAAQTLNNIFTAFGMAAETTTRIGGVATGISNLANNYFLIDELFNDKILRILSTRRTYKAFIVAAWQKNIDRPYDQVKKTPYSVLQLLIDIDRYHKLCGIYDQVYYVDAGANINNRIKELFAYQYITDDNEKKRLLET